MSPCTRDEADVLIGGISMFLDTVPEYFMAKNMQAWGAHVALPWGETWESLAERLDARFGQHIWHPSHWKIDVFSQH